MIKLKKTIFLLVYIILPVVIFISSYYVYERYSIPPEVGFCLALADFLLFSLLNVIFNGYKIGIYRILEIIYSNFLSIIITNVLMGFLLFVYFINYSIFFWMIILILSQTVISVIWAWLLNTLYYTFHEYNEFLLIYGSNPDVLINKLQSHSVRYSIKSSVDIQNISDLKELQTLCDQYNSIFLYDVTKDVKDYLTLYCFDKSQKLFYVPDTSEIIRSGTTNLFLIDTPILFSEKWGISFEESFFKRVLDLLIIIPATIITSPIVLVVALIIKLYDHGPVIYKQERLTKDGRKFNVYKFRSMIVDAEKNGAQLAQEQDDRITPVGKVIRKLRLDELPQLFNILMGDMSIVGPRPERPEIAEQYCKEFPEFSFRLKVKAGLTGYAQVYGRYNTTPIDKVKLDLFYIQNYTMFLDIKLILYTIKILFLPSSTEGIDNDKKNAL